MHRPGRAVCGLPGIESNHRKVWKGLSVSKIFSVIAKFRKWYNGEEKKAAGKPGGRRRGSLNAMTRLVKDVFAQVFNELQDDPKHSLMAFAKGNLLEFYKLAAKLIPTQITGNNFGPVKTKNVSDMSEDELMKYLDE